MSAVVPKPEPGDPFCMVIYSEQEPNFRRDYLVCGHVVVDYDNRRPKRRRCRQCGQELSS